MKILALKLLWNWTFETVVNILAFWSTLLVFRLYKIDPLSIYDCPSTVGVYLNRGSVVPRTFATWERFRTSTWWGRWLSESGLVPKNSPSLLWFLNNVLNLFKLLGGPQWRARLFCCAILHAVVVVVVKVVEVRIKSWLGVIFIVCFCEYWQFVVDVLNNQKKIISEWC